MFGGTGWNKNQVELTMNNVVTICKNLDEKLEEIQPNFIVKMADCWASPEAKEFFIYLTTELTKIQNNINTIFPSINAAIRSSVQLYQEQDRSQDVLEVEAMPECDMGLDNTVILSVTEDGFRGINIDLSKDYINGFVGILDSAQSIVNSLSEAVKTSGFYGADNSQQNALNDSMRAVSASINNMKTYISENAQQKINDTAAAYGTITTTVSQRLTAQEVSGN